MRRESGAVATTMERVVAEEAARRNSPKKSKKSSSASSPKEGIHCAPSLKGSPSSPSHSNRSENSRSPRSSHASTPTTSPPTVNTASPRAGPKTDLPINMPQIERQLPKRSMLKNQISGKNSGLSTSSSAELASASSQDTPVISVTKALAQLQSTPSNRSCAECRSPLLDSSQIFVSFTPSLAELPSAPHVQSAVGEFSFHHLAFAPPGTRSKNRREPMDPATRATQLVGGFGVFVCAACAAAHKSLGSTIAEVHSPIDTSWWTPEQVDFLLKGGGNSRSWQVFEKYMPESWQKRRPNNASTHTQRQIFVRTKYDALAFLTPRGGPLAGPAWSRIVQGNPELQRFATKELENYQKITISEKQNNLQRLGSAEAALPSRLVDFFCVVGHSGKLTQAEVNQNLAERNSPEELCFDVAVKDCYPSPDAYDDMDFPEHVSTFVFPDGCRPSQRQQPPSFFTFVLTSANGQRLYGAAMHVYDDQMDTENIRNVIADSGYTVPLPWWLHNEPVPPTSGQKGPSEVVYIPKCLAILSHYPFFDIWRRFLTQLYRITIVEAPLPIERYIANFVSEVPLPPQGKVEVKFAFTTGDLWSIKRPPVNELPLRNFSYLPLFATLSVGNILVVNGCLMQETRVALLSSHYSLLAPVAEALLSLLFPFEWQGMYIPIMPFTMLDILDAPVPFLVGLHSRYLAEVPSKYRPKGVVFVNLDKDEVHLGYEDEGSRPRFAPELPERDAMKLKAKLEEFGGSVYLTPSSKLKGRVLTGNGDDLQNSSRPSFSQWATLNSAPSGPSRIQTFRKTDAAFPDGKQLDPISGFLSEQGYMAELSYPSGNDSKARDRKARLKKLVRKHTPNGNKQSTKEVSSTACSLLEMEEPDGFSGTEIRNAFLRFFVSVFNNYEKYLVNGSGSDKFRNDDFVSSLNLPSKSQHFVSGILATQMFQRFVQERKENPSSPPILFFDQSIIAKNNRSKKTTLTSGGKKETPFLDDTSMKIQEVFTPPPPSNWGLEDGRRYHYGSFPTLDAKLFGKVRPPKQWPQQDAGTYRIVAKAAALKQQELIAKAMGPRASVPTVVTSSGGRSNVRDIEWAIHVLSKVAGADAARAKTGESLSSAQQQVLAARRKQGILLDIVITIQACCRMYIARRHYLERRKALITLQRRSRRTSPEKEQQEFRNTIECAVVLQSLTRFYFAKKRYQRLRNSSIAAQSLIRGAIARQKFKQLKASHFLQRWIRGSLVRCYMAKLRRSTILSQAIVRGRRSRFGYTLLFIAVSKSQALFRGYRTRKFISSLVKKRTMRYRQQIFVLWHHAHTPLAYRTKMWPLLDGSGFLSLTFAEGELERLWNELDIVTPPSPRQDSSPLKGDEHLVMAQRVGISSPCYLQFSKVQAMIERSKQNGGKTPWFAAECSPHWKKAAEREKLERLQVYERLHAETDRENLNTMYKYFEIDKDAKLKKRTLVERLWSVETHATRSVAVMVGLFPELEYGTYLNFVTPSRKGQKLFHVKNQVPSPLDSSMQVEVVTNQLIKSNLKEFAMAHAQTVPGLLLRLDDREQEKMARFMLQKRAEMFARREDWPRCRRKIMLSFLYPGRKRRSKSKRKSRKQPSA